MKTSYSWIRQYVDLPDGTTVMDLTDRLTALGLKLESLEDAGASILGPLVLGRVLTMDPEPQKNGKTINWCTVDVGNANGTGEPQGIVCGAHNFGPGDLVVVVLPGGVLPGGFEISARKTYGHVSAGMICSARELGLGDDHDGIIVLPTDAGEPGQDARPVLGLDDELIEFEINPDRAYALSLRGIARESALAYEVPFTDPADLPVNGTDDGGYPIRVEVGAGCPVFVARSVTGFDPTRTTPDWMVRRLRSAGMRPISLAVDITNYVMLELGQPIHGFDRNRLQGPIVVRYATEGEKLTTLDGQVRTLDAGDMLITDDSGPIGLAGVMGGETTELSADTTDVVIEAAHWDPVTIFRTARRHKLPSEAAKRFERGVDPRLPQAAAQRVADLMAELGGATIETAGTTVGTAPERVTIQIPIDLPARISGMPIDNDTTVAALKAIGGEVTVDGESRDIVTMVAPSWRPDLTDPYDLVEEVVRIVGYDNVPSVLPNAPGGRGLTREQRLRRRIGRAAAADGMVEVVNFPFIGDAAFDALGIEPDDPRRDTVRLANPLSTEEPSYTTTLLAGLLRTAARNLGRGAGSVGIFETGVVAFPAHAGPAPIYGVDRRPTDEELAALFAAVPRQPLHLGAVLTGERERSGWWGAGREASWADAIALVRRIAADLDADLTVRAAHVAPWHPGRCAEFAVAGEVVGHAGELHPRVCAAFGIPARSAAVEIDLDVLMAHTADPTIPVISAQPLAKEDVALLVPADVSAADVAAALREGAGELCESVRLFDVYTGAQVGEGQKSLAFALRFRAADRTLTEAETATARDAAVALAADRFGAVQRS